MISLPSSRLSLVIRTYNYTSAGRDEQTIRCPPSLPPPMCGRKNTKGNAKPWFEGRKKKKKEKKVVFGEGKGFNLLRHDKDYSLHRKDHTPSMAQIYCMYVYTRQEGDWGKVRGGQVFCSSVLKYSYMRNWIYILLLLIDSFIWWGRREGGALRSFFI